MLATMTPLPANMRRAAAKGFINATDCADYLTKKGMPFRDAYKCTGTMVAACIREGKTLEELGALWDSRAALTAARQAYTAQEQQLADCRENPMLQQLYKEEEAREKAWDAARAAVEQVGGDIRVCQKQLASLCRAAGVPFMVVTQMLDSMQTRAVPTRAEVSDIYNAVLDGAASLMLTGETAAGQYPVQAMEYLVKTAQTAL